MTTETKTRIESTLSNDEDILSDSQSKAFREFFAVPGVIVPDSPVFASPAVALCAASWQLAYIKTWKKHEGEYFSEKSVEKEAAKAFRGAMPPLRKKEDIAEFVACVSFGVLIGAIAPDESGRLLYAAQVAAGLIAAPKLPTPATAKSKPAGTPAIKPKTQKKRALTPPPPPDFFAN